MSTDEVKALVMRFVDEPWNKGNLAAFDEICAPGYTLRYMSGSETGNIEDIKKAVLDMRKTATEFKATVNEIIVEGDRVAYAWTMETLAQGKWNKTVGITLLRLQDGRVIDDRFLADEVKETAPAA